MRITALLSALALTGGVLAAPASAQEKAGDVWVLFTPEANLSTAAKTPNRTARGRQVVDALKATAVRSQARVRSLLAEEGLDSESFWATNAIYVEDATPAQAAEIAAIDGVEQVRSPIAYRLAEPVERAAASVLPSGLEWGVANINADDAWLRYGKRGEGIVVASIDTGVQYDHPALVRSYRGNNGDGTFTHDYNWFDASANCPSGAPCDTHGHGTHTMGTMAGDDGRGNQIGVAPGVRWIAANGCHTCTEVDLVRSAQWMLAPTDARGQHPDVSKRPHIVNNSWATTVPTDQPLIEDVLQAWAASGIFGVWANGNLGPRCRTSGAPGSRKLNYSVGAYGADNRIASYSSRGPGQDGEPKPSIAAPGSSVRSAIPGDTYGLMSGTSMAAPHVSGAVALLWSAFPDLARDVEGTRALLDLSAANTADGQCGGTSDDNNVYGEGRLDAAALLALGQAGLGTLAGAVTDTATRLPIRGATVSVTGQRNRSATTGTDGAYSLRLPPGEYQVTARAAGYTGANGTATVTKNGTITLNLPLDRPATVLVGGTVKDGSGQGRPLAATVTATDSEQQTFTAQTDPATGAYRLELPPDRGYTLDVAAATSGYAPSSKTITVGTAPLTEDVTLAVTPDCVAPGYLATLRGPTESFNGGRPRGWTVTTTDPGDGGHHPGWVFDNPAARTNATGGSGDFAIAESAYYGLPQAQETMLTGPSVNMSGYRSPALRFAGDLEPAAGATASVDVSTDGGRTWATVWTRPGFPGARGPEAQVVPLPQAAGKTRVRVRFRYAGALPGRWAVDDVFLGDRTCAPVPLA